MYSDFTIIIAMHVLRNYYALIKQCYDHIMILVCLICNVINMLLRFVLRVYYDVNIIILRLEYDLLCGFNMNSLCVY